MTRERDLKRRKYDKVLRIGDTAILRDTRRVLRVGYPKALVDYKAELEGIPEVGGKIWELLRAARGKTQDRFQPKFDQAVEDILWKLAKDRALRDSFGGRERSVHLVDSGTAAGSEVKISSLRSVNTGLYCSPSPSAYDSFNGDWDGGDTGGLENMKVTRIAEVFLVHGWTIFNQLAGDRRSTLEFPVSHLEKVIPAKEG